MTLTRKAYSASTEALAEKRQVKVICSTGEVDRSGEIVVQAGIDTSAYMAAGAGTVLWNHNPDKPIAKCVEIGPMGADLAALVQFPPLGEDPEADLYYAKIKFGSVSGVSIGFNPVETEPMDKANPKRGPQRYVKSELMEFSFTPVQANRGAIVVERAAKSAEANWKVGASRNLPIDMESAWDGAEAETSIFDQADFESDSPDTTFARKGFLAYDAANADLKGSYKLPFAKVVDGRLTAVAAGIRAASSRLSQADISDDVARKAQAVIDHYEEKMKEKAGTAAVKKTVVPKIKGLYQVANLAALLNELGYLGDVVEWEAAYEEDGSQVPAMLDAALRQLGEALIAMTIEEVAEMFADETAEGDDTVAKGICSAKAKPFTKAFVAANLKAGRKFSGESIATMQEACKNILSGHEMITGLLGQSTDDTEKSAASDRDKAIDAARKKRMREAELLRLAAV